MTIGKRKQHCKGCKGGTKDDLRWFSNMNVPSNWWAIFQERHGSGMIDAIWRVSGWWCFKDFLFLPLTGEDSQFDEHIIFQRGWFNHQLGLVGKQTRKKRLAGVRNVARCFWMEMNQRCQVMTCPLGSHGTVIYLHSFACLWTFSYWKGQDLNLHIRSISEVPT